MTDVEAIKLLKKFNCKDCKFAACEQCEINQKEVEAIQTLVLSYQVICDTLDKANKKIEELEYDISNMYYENVVVSIISDGLGISMLEAKRLLGEEVDDE